MSLVSFMSESMSAEQSSLMFNPLSNIVRSIIADANGAMLDPSDMTTMFQDAAGTIPVTAVEQPVGKILDKSGNGNHATQSVTASRPTLSARYNLLLSSQEFDNAGWGKNVYGVASTPAVTANYGAAPDGTSTADRIVFALNSGATSGDKSELQQMITTTAEAAYTQSIWLKTSDGSTKTIQLSFNGENAKNITVTGTWQRFSNTGTASDTVRGFRLCLRGATGTSDSADLLAWGAQQQLGSVAGPYQRVNTATDYDTDERYFPKYLSFDGVDDYLNLPYMGLYTNGGASIITGRDALSQATDTYIISERSTASTSPKYLPSRQLASSGNMDAYIADDAGTAVLDTTDSAFGGVSNAVISSVIDAGNSIKLFKNGSVAASDNYTRAGTLTLNTTTIGASVSTTISNYAKKKLYGLLITKSALSDAQRIQCERLLARKAGVIL